MLTCYLTRKRIGAYLDGALEGAQALSAARHLAGCPACQREADELRRTRTLLRQALSAAPGALEPDWTGFWPGILRGIEAAKHRASAPARRLWLTPRWAFGSALVAAFLVSMILWNSNPFAPITDAPVVVSSANSDYPGASLMVYHTPDREVTVVWVFGLDD